MMQETMRKEGDQTGFVQSLTNLDLGLGQAVTFSFPNSHSVSALHSPSQGVLRALLTQQTSLAYRTSCAA